MKDGYVKLRYPADAEVPEGAEPSGVVRAEHVDAYLAEGWTLYEDESEDD